MGKTMQDHYALHGHYFSLFRIGKCVRFKNNKINFNLSMLKIIKGRVGKLREICKKSQ